MEIENLLNQPIRLAVFFGWMFILWLIEFGVPLVHSKDRKVLPNIFLTLTMLLLNLFFASPMFFISEWTTTNHFGLFNAFQLNVWIQLFGGILILDFWAAYVIHRFFHKISWLWRLHSVHHSDPMVDITTAFRQHPVESGLRIAFLLVGMLFLGLPLWMVLVYQTLSSFSAQLEHANIKINLKLDSLLQMVFVTPNYHKIHHSKFQLETDSNYSNIFSIWDWIFFTRSKIKNCNDINYGLDYLTNAKDFSFNDLIKLPLKK